MTARDKIELLNLIRLFSEEEIDCSENCINCYYNVSSHQIELDNCPILIAYDMIYRKIYRQNEWNKKKG